MTITAAALAEALTPFKKLIERRTSIPILENVLLRAKNGLLTITGTDLDTELTVDLPLGFAGDGPRFATTAPFRVLLDFASGLGEAPLTLSLGAQTACLNVDGPVSLSMATLPTDDYPRVKPGASTVAFSLPVATLLGALKTVRDAMSREETRYYLNGILLQHIEDRLCFTATDGHRLHQVRLAAPESLTGLADAIVPRRAAELCIDLLEREPATAETSITLTDSKVRIECGRWALLSKLIDGTYPDYPRVIPTEHKGALIVEADALVAIADACRVFDNAARGGVLALGQGQFKASSAEGIVISGDHHGTVEGEPPEEIGFNHRYLAAVLSQRPGAMARMSMGDAASPVLVEFEHDESFRAVLMPMRI